MLGLLNEWPPGEVWAVPLEEARSQDVQGGGGSMGVGCELGTVIVGVVGRRMVVSSGSSSISTLCCGAGSGG